MTPQVVTPPARFTVSLAEARLQLNIDTQDYDARLAGLISAATEMVEAEIGRSLITRTYKGFLNWWPLDGMRLGRVITLPNGPVQSVAYLKTYDDADVVSTFDPANYYVDTARTAARIVLRRGAVWPNLVLRVANGIEISWVAGYGDNPGDTPEPIRLAIQMTVGALNEQRGDETTPPVLPPAAQRLLSPFFRIV